MIQKNNRLQVTSKSTKKANRENSNELKNSDKIIFRNNKRKVGIDYTIYTNRKIIGHTTNITNKGITVPLEIGNYFVLPKTVEERLSIEVHFQFTSSAGKKLVFSNVCCDVYVEREAYKNRQKKKFLRDVVYLKPKEKDKLDDLRLAMKTYNKIRYTIDKQLLPTDYYLKAMEIRNTIPDDFDISTMELITSGGLQKAQFEIYQNEKGQLFVRTNTSIRIWGKITLSAELNNHIEDFFCYDLLLCKKDEEEPIIIKTLPREIEGRKVFEIRFPHFSNTKENVTIIFTHPTFSLTKLTKMDYQTKIYLRKIGYPIKAFYSQFYNGGHIDTEIELAMREMVKQALTSTDKRIYPDVQITIDNPNENEIGNKHAFDDFIVDESDNSLILIDYKTSFTRTKHVEIDSAIAEMEHFKRKLGNNIAVIIIMNDDLFKQNKIITSKFGRKNNIVLIGKTELEAMLSNPTLLLEKINLFKEKIISSLEINEIQQHNNLVESFNNLSEPKNRIFQKYRLQIIEKIPEFVRIISTLQINTKGRKFEQEVQKILEDEDYDVVTNVLLGYFDRKMEIDLMGFKGDKMIIVSCRDASGVKCLRSFRLDIKQKVNKIEHRKLFLNADAAFMYIKTTREVYQQLKEFEGTWVNGVKIIFVVI